MPLSAEDALTYLPRKPLQEFAKGRVIYDSQLPNTHLYVVIRGRVKIDIASDDGCRTIGRILSTEGMFGESCLVASGTRNESAAALDSLTLMSWHSAEVERQIEREPRLGVALAQYLVRQCMEMQDRIESMAVQKTPERVMSALLQLAADLGKRLPDGSVRMPSLTHHTLAEFVGTSREIVTFQLNRLRRQGLIRYSRQYLDVYAEAVSLTLQTKGAHIPDAAAQMTKRVSRQAPLQS